MQKLVFLASKNQATAIVNRSEHRRLERRIEELGTNIVELEKNAAAQPENFAVVIGSHSADPSLTTPLQSIRESPFLDTPSTLSGNGQSEGHKTSPKLKCHLTCPCCPEIKEVPHNYFHKVEKIESNIIQLWEALGVVSEQVVELLRRSSESSLPPSPAAE